MITCRWSHKKVIGACRYRSSRWKEHEKPGEIMTEMEIEMDMKKRMVMKMASSTNLRLWPFTMIRVFLAAYLRRNMEKIGGEVRLRTELQRDER